MFLTQHKFISKLNEFYEIVDNESYVVHQVIMTSEEVCQVFYSEKDQLHSNSKTTSLSLAAFTTSQARV